MDPKLLKLVPIRHFIQELESIVNYVWYCWPMLIRNFCIDYKKNWWQFDEAVEAWLLYRSV